MRFIHIARSAVLNWFATASTLLVSYFLAPFLIHRLGNIEYGIWVLALSTTGYLYLLDLGLRSSVLRFVSRAHAAGDHDEASRIVSAVLWVRLMIGGLILLIATILSTCFPRLFRLPEELWTSSRQALFIIGLTISLTMPMSAIGAVLSALNRYDLQSYISLLQLAIRSAGIVLVVHWGKGIVGIALCELVAALTSNVVMVTITRHIYPELRIRLKIPSRRVLRPLWSYGSYSFILLVSLQLVYQADNLIVGIFVSAAGVTLYSIGNSLCRYSQQLFSAVTNTFVSVASVYESSGAQARLRALYLNGTRAVLVLSLPVLLTLIIRAQSFISLWIGPQYSRPSGRVTTVLTLALMLAVINSTASSIAIGIEKHKLVAIWALFEASLNLLLSIVLVRKMGLMGVALGTLVPSIIINLVLWPLYIPRILEVRRSEFFTAILAPVGLCAGPFAVASLLANTYLPPRSMTGFLCQTVVLLAIFYITVFAFYWDSVKNELFPRMKQVIVGVRE